MKLLLFAGASILTFTLIALGPQAVHAGTAEGPRALEQTVQYLLDYVARSELTFIRNSKRYTSSEAAEHMRAKYQHFKDKIKTADDFIELAASKSLLSGKLYLVVTEQGEAIPSGEWLRGVLADYRGQHEADRLRVRR